jgi:hypothetical protein
MRTKLEDLCIIEGKCILTLLADYPEDKGKFPGICVTSGCNRTTIVGNGETEGECPTCHTKTVVSGRILMKL